MTYCRRLFGALLGTCLIASIVSFGQAQKAAVVVPWDELNSAALDLKHSLESGNGATAHMRVIQMELSMAGAPQAAKIGDQIAEMERRPIPQDHNPSLAQFLPQAEKLLRAISDADAGATNECLKELNSDISQARLEQFRRVRAAMAREATGTTILKLQKELGDSLSANSIAKSVMLAGEMQDIINELVSRREYISRYALGHYMINDALGRAAFLRGDYQSAAGYLLSAAQPPPGADDIVDLDYFGPNLWLARQLLGAGKNDVVLKFLETCRQSIWPHDNEKVDPWIAAIKAGKHTDLAPNSLVGYGY